jgi:hypothetical protein
MTLHKAIESAWLLLGTLPVLANSMHEFPAEYVFENMFFSNSFFNVDNTVTIAKVILLEMVANLNASLKEDLDAPHLCTARY